MRSLFRTTVFLLLTLWAITLYGESAKDQYKQGQRAEARQDYVAAYQAYRAAYEQKPEELKYRIAFERMRSRAASVHVNQGQKLRDDGKLTEAMAEFDLAARIDPSMQIAFQEIRKTKAMISAQEKTGQPVKPTPPPSPIARILEEAAGPIELAPVSQAPITLEIANDSKMVYETIGKLAGINVLFDPDYTSRRITLKLNGVSLREALDIVAFNSNTFWRPITSNTIYVASNTQQKRKELEQSVLKTFYLSNVSTPTDLQDVTNALRQILEMQKVQQVTAQNAIIVRGTPDQVALAEKIIGDLDKAKPEVIVEIAIMQVRRDKVRQLGITPPTSASIALQPTVTPTNNTNTGNNTTTNVTATVTNSINLNDLANLNAKDFVVTIPPASASFLFTDDNTKLIQNPQIRASDGQKATLKIGDRIPIATGSFGSGFGGTGLAGANGLVNTQFQYIDVGVNIDITPRVYTGREIGLKLVLDVSNVTGSSNIGGITQPIISQRKIEHDIRLKEGEVNLLGGIFENTDLKTLNGIPGLGQLPFLKYLFSQEKKERIENEIVFVMVPHIVRAQEISEFNQKALDVGTSTTLDLRRVSKPVAPATPAPQTPAPQPQPPAPPPPGGGQPQAEGTAPKQQLANNLPATLRFDPPAVSQAAGSTFNVNVIVNNGQDIYAAPMQISYDPKLLQLVSISNGDLLSRDGQPIALVHREDVETGTIQANASRPPGSGGINGDGILYTLTFQAKGKGDTVLSILRPSARNSAMAAIPLTPAMANVSIK